MTEAMEAIWSGSAADPTYKKVESRGFGLSTYRHEDGVFLLTISTEYVGDNKNAFTQSQFHMTRETMTNLADLLAQTLGGCLYIASEDSESEMGMAELDVGPDGLYA
jgi:hypothetical protein